MKTVKIISALTALSMLLPIAPVYSASGDAQDMQELRIVEENTGGDFIASHIVDEDNNEVVPDTDEALFSASDLPSSYTAPHTSTKDQGTEGCCWAFGAISTCESSLLTKGAGEYDFSEAHLAYFGHNTLDTKYNDGTTSSNPFSGGNNYYTLAALMKWNGLELEEHLPYNSKDTSAMTPTEEQRWSSYAMLSSFKRVSFPNDDVMKQAILDYGAVTLDYYSNTTYYADKNGDRTYYLPSCSTAGNHLVSVIGWDDNYSAENFSTTPEHDGAWLVKNSWGESWGPNDGLFWMSYDSAPAKNAAFGIFDASENTVYDNIYSHTGGKISLFVSCSGAQYAANVYTAQNDEILSAVSTYLYNCESGYKVEVRTGIDSDDPTSGTLAASASSDFTGEGMEVLSLDNSVEIEAGTRFSVIIKPKGTIYIAREDVSSGNATASEGESFFTGSDTYEVGSFFINAYTKNAEGDYTSDISSLLAGLRSTLTLAEDNDAKTALETEIEKASAMQFTNEVSENNEIIYLNTLADKLTVNEITYGDPTSELVISNASELIAFANATQSGNTYSDTLVKLAANIELDSSQENNMPQIHNFYGVFDGQGYTISGVNISAATVASGAIGLFDYVYGTIRNLEVKDAIIESTASVANLVGVVGVLDGTVENCRFDAQMTVKSGVSSYSAPITHLQSSAKINNFYTTSHPTNPSGVNRNGIIQSYENGVTLSSSMMSNCYALNCGYASTSASAYTTLKTSSELQSSDFLTLLNSGIGTNMTWYRGSDGYPTMAAGGIIISDAQELAEFASATQSGMTYDGATVKLANDITFDSSETNPISPIHNFYGTFDGQGHKISGLNLSGAVISGASFGLFDMLLGTVKNLEVTDTTITSTATVQNFVGIVGLLYGTVENCRLDADMSVVSGSGAVYAPIAQVTPDSRITNVYTTSHAHNSAGSDRNGLIISGYNSPVYTTVMTACYALDCGYASTTASAATTLMSETEMKSSDFVDTLNDGRGSDMQWYTGEDGYPSFTEVQATPTPTAAPTATPTAAPTATPTAAPTATPSPSPTPTTAPTASPTPSPTAAPVSGTTGDLTWTYGSGTISISGNGSMAESSLSAGYPWYKYISEMKTLTTSGTITAITNMAFAGSSLESVTLGSGLSAIDSYAFAYCESLTSVTIPKSVTEISDTAFLGCTSDLVIKCPASSYAAQYAKEHDIAYEIITLDEFDAVVTVANGKVIITANVPDSEISMCVHAAIYNSDGTIIDYIAVPAVYTNNTVNIVFDDNENMAYAKVFLWNSLTLMQAVTESIQLDIER